MAQKNKVPSPNAGVMKAIKEIKTRQSDPNDPKSLADIANMLRTQIEFDKVDKSTIGRWLNYDENAVIQPKTRVKIINAARHLQQTLIAPVKLSIGVIKRATEMLPAHLIEKYPAWQKGVKVQIERKDAIAEIGNALMKGEVDLAIMPKGFNANNKRDEIKRFFQLSSIETWGLFPFGKQPDNKSFAAMVEESLKVEGKAVGFLPNADYEQVLLRLLSKYSVEMPLKEVVRSHDDALTKLKAGEIHAVVGHSVFILNLQKSLRQHPGGAAGEHAETLESLKKVEPAKLFDNVEMDVFINSKKITAEAARCGYRLLYHSVQCMNYERDEHLARYINEVLGLDSEDAKSGLAILNSVAPSASPIYDVKRIDPAVLNDLWKK